MKKKEVAVIVLDSIALHTMNKLEWKSVASRLSALAFSLRLGSVI